ncbi:unnamed protein product, partial [Choristocarpus tenellus]
ATKIQAWFRRCRVVLRTKLELQNLLESTKEEYLVEESLTPDQFMSIVSFQHHIRGYLRRIVKDLMAQRIQRFITRVHKRLKSLLSHIAHSEIKGLAVNSSHSNALASAIAKAQIVMDTSLRFEDAKQRASTVVSNLSSTDCLCLRPFSRANIPEWPYVGGDVSTDGLFLYRRLKDGNTAPLNLTPETTSPKEGTPFSCNPLCVGQSQCNRQPGGLFRSVEVRGCSIKRRGASFRWKKNSDRDGTRRDGLFLLMYRSSDPWMLARVLCFLWNRQGGAVPTILEHQLYRCAAVTRIQAAWRGHVLRWNLLPSLTSCVIILRATICIQRWWRALVGLKRHFNLLHRLWAMASAVSMPTLYIESDVFHLLTSQDQLERKSMCAKFDTTQGRIAAFGFQNNDRVVIDDELLQGHPVTTDTGGGLSDSGRPSSLPRRSFPYWLLPTIPRFKLSQQHSFHSINKPGALLTTGVEIRQVEWPIIPPKAIKKEESILVSSQVEGRGSSHLPIQESTLHRSSKGLLNVYEEFPRSPCRQAWQCRLSSNDQTPVDLTQSHPGLQMLQLTYCSTEEARARALVLAVVTQESGVRSNLPLAQLFSLEMLSIAEVNAQAKAGDFDRGRLVEILPKSLEEGRSAGIAERAYGNGTYQVHTSQRYVSQKVQDTEFQCLEYTNQEKALVDLSYLPSPWRRLDCENLTISDRVNIEFIRRSLPSTRNTCFLSDTTSPQKFGHRAKTLISKSTENTPRQMPSMHLKLPVVDRLGHTLGASPHIYPSRPHSAASAHTKKCVMNQAEQCNTQHWGSSHGFLTGRGGEIGPQAASSVGLNLDVVTGQGMADAVAWVPDNRFHRDLEKLISLASMQAVAESKARILTDKRDAVQRARSEEHVEPTPRERLQRLRIAETAWCRREASEQRKWEAGEQAEQRMRRMCSAVAAREAAQKRQEAILLSTQETQMERAMGAVEDKIDMERKLYQILEARRTKTNAVQERAREERETHARYAMAVSESAGFSSKVSQLQRCDQKNSFVKRRARERGSLKQQVLDKRAHKDEMRHTLLCRTKEQQMQKR